MKIKFSISIILIVLSIFFFISQGTLEVLFGYDIVTFYGAKINQFILQGQIWRFLTPVFLHGSIVHLCFNMYALFSIGPSLERKYGKLSFILLYLFGALFGNIVSFLFSPNMSLGSSTAIFGLIAAQGVYIYKNRFLLGNAARPMLMNILFMIAVNFVLGLSPGIDNWGHLGGMLGGFLYAWFAGPTFSVVENVFGDNVLYREDRKMVLVLFVLLLCASFLIILGFLLN